MPGKNSNSSSGGNNERRRRRSANNKNKNAGSHKRESSNTPTDNQSTASSSKTAPPSLPQKLLKNDAVTKVKILKRESTVPQNTSLPMVPLMDLKVELPGNVSKQCHTSSWNETSATEKTTKSSVQTTTIANNLDVRRQEANKHQTHAYYFSEKAGSAVSPTTFQETNQYSSIQNFPLERYVNIQLDKKYSLMITPTTNRCNGLFIRVRSQHGDDSLTTGALLKLDSDEQVIRKACKETIENYTKVSVKCQSERYPFSKCSEEYLKSCLIERLDDRLDAFPEAIYYCKKCDYHINTISHAKAHLESSSHFDDIKRQHQREQLVKQVPSPTQHHLKAINKVLTEVLAEYKEFLQVQQKGKEKAELILHYLNDSVFPSIDCHNVVLKTFGSATYDVVLPDSDFNVAYTMDFPEGTPIFALLEKVRRKIMDDGYPAEHSMEMGTPSTIIFSFEGVRVRLCWMSCFNYRSQLHLSDLMKTYVGLRKEVVQFLQLIRLWACRAGVDSKNKPRIGLPRYGFDIMAIHFLQERKCLPVLHEIYEEDPDEEKMDEQISNRDDCSEKSRIPPEEAGQRRIRLMSRYEKDIKKIKAKFNLNKKWDNAELFIQFFRFYVEKHREVVIQITQSQPMSRDANRWNKKVLHVVDPFRGDNVLSIPKVSTWQPFYFNCLLSTFLSFAIPRTKNGPLMVVELIHSKTSGSKKKVKEPSTSVRNGETAPPPTLPAIKPMSQITEEQYRAAADELAEEREHMAELFGKMSIDGLKYTQLKPENFHIDDHWQSVYSQTALRRFRRVFPSRLNEKIACSLEEYEFLLTKKGKKMMRSWKKSQEEIQEIDKQIVKVTENLENKLEIIDDPVDQKILPEVSPMENIDSTNDPPSEEKTEKAVSTEIPVEKNEENPSSLALEEGKEICVQEKLEEVKISLDSPTGSQIKSMDFKEEQSNRLPEVLEAQKDENELKMNRSIINKTFEDSPTKEPVMKQSATFVKKGAPLVVKQICLDEFFLKENLDFKDLSSSKCRNLKESEFNFEFSSELFCGGYEMEMKCTYCDGSHCVENCPMMEIPPIVKYEARTAEDLKDIDNIIDKYYQENILDEKRMQLMESKKDELEIFLQKHYREDINLTIFGSVKTGLSVNCSDIDICLKFGDGDTPPKDLTPKEVILKTEEVLRHCGSVKRVQAIVNAKVPIVKFQLKLSNGESVDADISYYNILAIYNTSLLREYTLWTPDHRFAKLALFIKKWAKYCEIGDASRGSLSSYAHVILLISYLQNCDPPVLPRLQEDFRNGINEKKLVENWDTSYAQGEDDLLKKWTKNKESCSQLLIGYFDYYSRFDFRNFVVQCRREMTLSKMEKDWPRPLCVEDPFDLSHNLSSGVTKKMFVFIMKVFINSRAVFMSEKPQEKRGGDFLSSYQQQLLRKCNQGSAPADRQCHNCHRIGHFVESCPQRGQAKDVRRRYGSNSTFSSYRSNDGYKNKNTDESSAEGGRLSFHKRAYYNRSYK